VPKRWLILAGLASLVAATSVLYWPVGPRWRSGPDVAQQIIGFGNEDRFLYTADALHPEDVPPSNARMTRWDAGTGKVLEEVRLAVPDGSNPDHIFLSPDGSVLVTGSTVLPPADQRKLLCDAHTGKLRAEIIANRSLKVGLSMEFSPDNRYLGTDEGNNLCVIATATAKSVLRVPPPRSGDNLLGCLFSQDSMALAVQWWSDSAFDCIQILDLANGKERCRFTIPPDLHSPALHMWVANRIYVVGEVQDRAKGPACYARYVFDLSSNHPGRGTLETHLNANFDIDPLHSLWLDGPDWVANYEWFELHGNGKWDQWREWLFWRLGIEQPSWGANLRFFERSTGKVCNIIQFPSELKGAPIITRDGKSVACLAEGGSVEVWDTDSPLRWPWAAIVGIASAGLVLLVGRWHSRRPCRYDVNG
jgi:hypothetical protein